MEGILQSTTAHIQSLKTNEQVWVETKRTDKWTGKNWYMRRVNHNFSKISVWKSVKETTVE